jgi:hypothetical protein
MHPKLLMTRAPLLVLGSALHLSCGGEADPLREAAPLPAPVPPREDAYAETLPTATFPTLDALCAAQRSLAAPHIAQALAAHAERYGEEDPDPEPLAPSCVESDALRDARVTLAPPYAEVRAIHAETGVSTDTFLVFRTSAGWTALREAFVSDEHDDPGCPSITRENAIADVHVDRGVIVVQTSADRSSFEAEDDGAMASLLFTHVRACGLAGCTEPSTIEARVVRDADRSPRADEGVFFQTTYALDHDGHIVTPDTFEP